MSIIMNWVVTAQRTVARSRSMRRSMSSGEKRRMRTVGAPRAVGVKCVVHRPNPKGAGTATQKRSSGVSAPYFSASW